MGLTVSPFSGPAGTMLDVSATDLNPNEAVVLTLDDGAPVAATTDANGALSLQLPAPRDWAPHLHYIYLRRADGSDFAEHPFRVVSTDGRARIEKTGPFVDRIIRELDGMELERLEFEHRAATRPSNEVAVDLRYEKAGRTRLEGRLTLNRTTGQLTVRAFNAHDSLLVIIEGELNEPRGVDPLARIRASVTVADQARVIKLEPGLELPENSRKRSKLVGELAFLAQRMRDSDLYVDMADLDQLANDAQFATPVTVLLATYYTFALLPHGGPLPEDLVPGLLIRLLRDELYSLATYHRFRDVAQFADDEDPNFAYLDFPEGVDDFDQWAQDQAETIRAGDPELSGDPECMFVGYSVERSIVWQITSRVPQTGWIYTGQNGGTSLTVGSSIAYFNRTVLVTEAEFTRFEIEFRYTCGCHLWSLGGTDDEERTRVYKKRTATAPRTYTEKEYKQTQNYNNGLRGKFVIQASHYPDPSETGSYEVVLAGLADVGNAEAALAEVAATFDPAAAPGDALLTAYTSLQRTLESTYADARRACLRADENPFNENGAQLVAIEEQLRRKIEALTLDLQGLAGIPYHPGRLLLKEHAPYALGLMYMRRFQFRGDVTGDTIDVVLPPPDEPPPAE